MPTSPPPPTVRQRRAKFANARCFFRSFDRSGSGSDSGEGRGERGMFADDRAESAGDMRTAGTRRGTTFSCVLFRTVPTKIGRAGGSSALGSEGHRNGTICPDRSTVGLRTGVELEEEHTSVLSVDGDLELSETRGEGKCRPGNLIGDRDRDLDIEHD
eukprot:461009_1